MRRISVRPLIVSRPVLLLATMVAAGLFIASAESPAAVVEYYPGSGQMKLDNSGLNYSPTLGVVQIFLPAPPALSSLDVVSDWKAYSNNTGSLKDIEWDGNLGTSSDALPQGVYPLTTLPAGLIAANFGYSLTYRGATYTHGPNDTLGAVSFDDIQGINGPDSALSAVQIMRTVPSQNDWTGPAGGAWSSAGNWTLAGSSTQRVPTSADTATFSNTALAGTVNVSGAQTAGSLWFDSNSPYTIAGGAGSALDLSSTAAIWIDAGLHTIAVPLALTGSLTVDAEPSSLVAPGSVGVTISGQITGASTLIKTGPGIVFLNNTNNTYNGTTSITGGTLSAVAAGSLGSGSLTIANATLDFSAAGTFAHNISLTGSGVNTIQADTGIVALSGVLSGSGGLTKGGNGTLALGNAGNSYSGGTNVAAGTLQFQSATGIPNTSAVTVAGGASLDLNGLSPALANISGSGAVTNTKPATTATLNAAYNSGSASYGAAIQDGAGQVAVNVPGGGLLTLSNTANTYSGGTTVSGTLSVSVSGNLGAGSGGLTLNNGVLQATSGFTLGSADAVTLLRNSVVDVAVGQTLAVGGVVSGAGSLTKTDGGTLLLTGANTFNDGISIAGGNLAVASGAGLGDSGGTVTIINGAMEFTNSTTASQTLNLVTSPAYVQVDAGTVTYAGPITGPGSLVKTGAGTLAITNTNNDYSGGTGITSGTLLDNDPTGKALGTGTTAVTVSAGGQLAGTGTISQPVACNGGGISPGQGSTIGTLYLQQGLALGNGGSVTFKLANQSGNPVSDCIDFETNPNSSSGVTWAGLSVGGTCTAYLTGTPMPATGAPYTLFDYVRTSSGNAPSTPTNLNLVPPPGYLAQWNVSPTPLMDNTTFKPYYQIYATLTGPTEWQTYGSGAWIDDSNWISGAPSNPYGANSAPLKSTPVLFGMNGSGTVNLTSGTTNYANVLIFNSSNSYTIAAPPDGTTSGGTLALGGLNWYLLDANDPTVNNFVEVIAGSHSITAPVELLLPTNITMYDPAAALAISGAVSGSGSLTLSGSGTLILSGSNSYGDTTVDGGILIITSAASLPSESSLTVAAGGTFIFDPSATATWSTSSGGAVTAAAIPEPGTLAILAAGATAWIAARSWRRRRARRL